MTSKEKAIELFDKFSVSEFSETKGWYISIEESKDMAKGVVDEIVKELQDIAFNYDIENLPFLYWNQVKSEIEKL
jgi:hypothetical protein